MSDEKPKAAPPRDWWIETSLGGPITGEGDYATIHSKADSDFRVHVIEYSYAQALEAKCAELEARLWVAKDSQLRTYDGLTDKADKYDALESRCQKLEAALQFYADERHVKHSNYGPAIEDGTLARQALAHEVDE
jgi:hypothetical protein